MIKSILKAIYKKLLSNDQRVRVYKILGTTLASNPMLKYDMFHHIAILKKLGFKPEFIVDAGAYKGAWTQQVLEIFPESTFLMIEAQSSKTAHLKVITEQFKNVHLENILLGDSERENVKFFEMETGSSIYEENTSNDRTEIFLEMKTLDSIATKYKIKGDCFLKMDVQGAEIDILKGAEKFLRLTEFILLEVSTLNYNENSPDFAEVVQYLHKIGYLLFDICDEHRTDENVLFQVDLIFVKSSSRFREAVNFKRFKSA